MSVASGARPVLTRRPSLLRRSIGVLAAAIGAALGAAGSTPAAAATVSMASSSGCGDLFIKTSIWGAWARHMGCGGATAVAISPDGRMIAVIDANQAIWAKQRLWGGWERHTPAGHSRALALGPDGMIANVTPCGALYIKTAVWGDWSEHLGCGSAADVAISPDGRTIGVVGQDGSIWAKQGLWGDWHGHTPVGHSKALALGPNGMMANVTPCGALYIKTALWGDWSEHRGCAATDVAVSPDGGTIAVIDESGAIHAKQGLWGTWRAHTQPTQTRAYAIGPAIYAPLPPPTHGTGQVFIRRHSLEFVGTAYASGLTPAGARIRNVRFTPTSNMGTVGSVRLLLNGEAAQLHRSSTMPPRFTTDAFNGRSPFGEWRAIMTFVDFHADGIWVDYDWALP